VSDLASERSSVEEIATKLITLAFETQSIARKNDKHEIVELCDSVIDIEFGAELLAAIGKAVTQ
jgi:hypothetical protein